MSGSCDGHLRPEAAARERDLRRSAERWIDNMDIKLLTDVEKASIGERQPLPERYLRLSDDEMDARIAAAKRTLGERVVILGHHYQRDEVIKFADYIGDSLKLSRAAASRGKAEFIVFCGVHFMAESADILRAPHQKVVLPDLAAGCSMADMAAPDQLDMCWRELGEMGVRTDASERGRAGVIPVTYINSSAGDQSVRRRRTAASSARRPTPRRDDLGVGARREAADAARPASWPQHRLQDGRAARRDGGVGSRTRSGAGSTPEQVERAKLILWKGHCSVHTRFTVQQIDAFRKKYPDGQGRSRIPSARSTSSRRPIASGSTEHIINTVKAVRTARLGGRDRSSPREPSRARGCARPDRGDARSVRLPLLDDVPRFAEPSAVDPRRAVEGQVAQPDHRSRSRRSAGARLALDRMLV